MIRSLLVVGLAVGLAVVPVRAAAPLAGSWKLTVPLEPGLDVTFLIALHEKDGRWSGEVTGCSLNLKVQPEVVGLEVEGGRVRVNLELDCRHLLAFDGVVAKDGRTLGGSYIPAGGQPKVTELLPSKLKNLDDEFDVARETFDQLDRGQALFDAAFVLLGQAGEKKLPAEEVRQIVEKVTAAAAKYGRRWERETAGKLAATLAPQPGLADLAVEQGRRAEKLLTDADGLDTRLQVLEVLAIALERSGNAEEAKTYRDQMTQLEEKDYAEYAKTNPPFKPERFTGRKAKTDRTVLFEVFTGAECPPCAASSLAFDGLMRTYTPAEAILLQFHTHIPVPDPLTSPDAEDRLRYYVDRIEGAPTVFVAGNLGPPGGGPPSAAERKYKAYRSQIEEELEKPAGVKLALSVNKTDTGYSVKATVSELEQPGEKVRLRFALAEERVRFAGGNGVRYHHMVVRSMPGGAKGFALPKKDHEQTVSINPEELRATLAKYLDEVPKHEGPFPRPERPLSLKNLKIVAFVQDDTTQEILHATQADLPR